MKLSYKNNSYSIDGVRAEIGVIAFKISEKDSKLRIEESDYPDLHELVKTVIEESLASRNEHILNRSMNDQKIKMLGRYGGEFYPHEQRHRIKNSLDMAMLTPFFWAKEPSGDGISIFIQSQENSYIYTKLILSGSVTSNDSIIKSTLACIPYKDGVSLASHYLNVWEKTMFSVCNGIRGQFSKMNSSSPDDNAKGAEAIFTIISEKIPAIALNNMVKIDYYGTEGEDGFIYTDVSVSRRGSSPKQPTVFEYLATAISILPTVKEKEIEFPAIYTSEPETNAMNYFDIESIIEPATEADIPAWVEFGLKYTDDEWDVFKAFIYSVFDSRNKGRQCLYQYDKGFTAKSVLQSVLVHFMGENNVAALQKDSLLNQFGFSKIWDKRLVILGDNKNKRIIHTEKIHMLLGGDFCDVEHKGRNSFSSKLSGKLIINGNVTPYIDANATHERTRVILLKPKMNQKVIEKLAAKDADGNIILDSSGNPQLLGDPTFATKLKSEFPKFLYICKESYERLCPTHGNIQLPKSIMESLYDLGEEEESLYDEVMEKKLCFNSSYVCKKADVLLMWKKHAERFGLDTSTNGYSNFITYLKNKVGVTEGKKMIDGIRVNCYIGMDISRPVMTAETRMKDAGIRTPTSISTVVGDAFL